jgi:hypothetical protein
MESSSRPRASSGLRILRSVSRFGWGRFQAAGGVLADHPKVDGLVEEQAELRHAVKHGPSGQFPGERVPVSPAVVRRQGLQVVLLEPACGEARDAHVVGVTLSPGVLALLVLSAYSYYASSSTDTSVATSFPGRLAVVSRPPGNA